MLVQIDPEACVLVINRLRAVADQAEDVHLDVVRAASHAHVSTAPLALVPQIATELRDLAADLRRRVDLALEMSTSPTTLTASVITLTLPGDDEDTATIARALGGSIASDLNNRYLSASEHERLTALLERYGRDPDVVAGLVDALGSDGVAAATAWATGAHPTPLDSPLVLPQEAAARLRFVEAFGTAMSTAWSVPSGRSPAAREAVVTWLSDLPRSDLGATGGRAVFAGLAEVPARELVDAVPSSAVLLMRPHELPGRFRALVSAASTPVSIERVRTIEAAFSELSAADQDYLARVEPWLVGNLDGAPFTSRITANRVAVHAAATSLSERLESSGAAWSAEQREAARDRLTDYERLLTPTSVLIAGVRTTFPGHQVVLFDPDDRFSGARDQSRLAEISGDLRTARAVAVLVPGTGTNLHGMQGNYDRAGDFTTASRGQVAVISWMGGALPAKVQFDAFSPEYANDLGPRLAAFTAGMGAQSVPVTVLGHSYGGSVVGAAEAAGMRVDRVVHVESAGIGPGVNTIDDYADPDTARYSMTAPGDLIAYAQALGGAVHGGDPDLLDGVTRLQTGWIDDSDHSRGPLSGPESHSGVFGIRSTAWQNMYRVITSGTPASTGAPTTLPSLPVLEPVTPGGSR